MMAEDDKIAQNEDAKRDADKDDALRLPDFILDGFAMARKIVPTVKNESALQELRKQTPEMN